MTTDMTMPLIEQRQELRRLLLAQRQQIALQLGPESATSGSYPRSMTMRFLMQRPALALRLLVGATNLLRGR
jgi:hypothetical protein